MKWFVSLFPRFWLLFLVSALCSLGFFSFYMNTVVATGNTFSLSGMLAGPSPWNNRGNAGSIWFTITSDPDLNPYIDEDFYLHGSFWSSNAGWITFDHADPAVTLPYIDCPADVLSWGLLCDAHGYAWSENIGWIHLGDDSSIASISSLQYNPDTLNFLGFGYSSDIGWIPFDGIKLTTVARGFQWKSYVVWNIAGVKAMNTAYNSISDSFDSVSFSNLLRDIRKRYVEMTRGYDFTDINRSLDYRILKNQDLIISGDWTANSEWWNQNDTRTYIVEGGDVVIEWSILGNDLFPRAIIALKNSSWSWGNIYVRGDLSSNSPDIIQSSLVAEGSIFSGRKNLWVPIYYIEQSLLKIPINQLYVHGSVISRNTIWGAANSTPVCPVLVETCNATVAKRYDFNYFRNFVPLEWQSPTANAYNLIHRAYTKIPLLDDYSFIIEYDSRILIDPPPWLDLYTVK